MLMSWNTGQPRLVHSAFSAATARGWDRSSSSTYTGVACSCSRLVLRRCSRARSHTTRIKGWPAPARRLAGAPPMPLLASVISVYNAGTLSLNPIRQQRHNLGFTSSTARSPDSDRHRSVHLEPYVAGTDFRQGGSGRYSCRQAIRHSSESPPIYRPQDSIRFCGSQEDYVRHPLTGIGLVVNPQFIGTAGNSLGIGFFACFRVIQCNNLVLDVLLSSSVIHSELP